MKSNEIYVNMVPDTIEYRGETFDFVHGSPFDRGTADSYYNRRPNPHWYPNGTFRPPVIEIEEMTPEQIRAYHAGYAYNEELGDKKEW